MKMVSEKAKIIYLVILLLFIIGIFTAWLDYIGLINVSRTFGIQREAVSVLEAEGDEPSLVAREEFEKSKNKLQERIEDLDKREAKIVESEKSLDSEREKLAEMRKGLELEKKKLELEQKKYSGYMRNVRVLAKQVESIEPAKAVELIVRWEDPLIIDVLRQIDSNAEESGKMSITSYLISLMPRNKASRIMYLMTQI
ncbi:MAG: hypothetical protein KBA61_03695 [Spirochaetes bacterium]|nr:hypothetical protein [Spirochaetota bacterium]HPA73160.1 hypothetical protein [Spirochaetota bacterium]